MPDTLVIYGIDDSPRGRILSAAAHLFRDRGFDRTTVRDIAATVGIQSGSIFHHFKSKDDILYSVMEEVIRFNTERMRQAVETGGTALEQLRNLVLAELTATIGDTHEAMSVMVREWRCLSADHQQRALALRDIYEEFWLTTLAALHRQGAFRTDPFIMRRLLTGMIGWAPNWFNNNRHLSVAGLAEIIVARVVGEEHP